MENETSEQFEERVLNKRAAQLFYIVKGRMVKQECLLLSELTVNNSRKQVCMHNYNERKKLTYLNHAHVPIVMYVAHVSGQIHYLFQYIDMKIMLF